MTWLPILCALAAGAVGWLAATVRHLERRRRWFETVRSHRVGLQAALLIVEAIDSVRGQHAAARLDRLHLELGDLQRELR